jgi:4-hydroxy-tetrahydrodipicolinate synthase
LLIRQPPHTTNPVLPKRAEPGESGAGRSQISRQQIRWTQAWGPSLGQLKPPLDQLMLIYNVPSRTSVDISNETVARLATLPNIVGIKDATGDLARASLMRQACGEGFIMLSGDDPSALGYFAHGGHGCISVTANVAPGTVASLFNALKAADWAKALYVQDRLIQLHRALFLDASPSPTKFALAHLGLCQPDVRLPIAPCAEAVQPLILEAMREAGVI